MAIKIKIPRVKGFRGSLKNPFFRAGLAAFLIISLVLFGVFSYYYIKDQKIVDKRFYGPIFANSARPGSGVFPPKTMLATCGALISRVTRASSARLVGASTNATSAPALI